MDNIEFVMNSSNKDDNNFPKILDFRFFLSNGGFKNLGRDLDYIKSYNSEILEIIRVTSEFCVDFNEIEKEANSFFFNQRQINSKNGVNKQYLYNYYYYLGGVYKMTKQYTSIIDENIDDFFKDSKRIRTFWKLYHNCFEVIEGVLFFNSSTIIKLIVGWNSEITNQLLDQMSIFEAFESIVDEVEGISKDRDSKLIEGRDITLHDFQLELRSRRRDYLRDKLMLQNNKQNNYNKSNIESLPTIIDVLTSELEKYGFYKLGLVSSLNIEKQKKLTQLISKYKRPEKVAMLDYLGFIKYTLENYSNFNLKRNATLLNRMFNPHAEDGSEMEKTIRSLIKASENAKYKAIEYKETVKKTYQEL